jgi:hypothetical protein
VTKTWWVSERLDTAAVSRAGIGVAATGRDDPMRQRRLLLQSIARISNHTHVIVTPPLHTFFETSKREKEVADAGVGF